MPKSALLVAFLMLNLASPLAAQTAPEEKQGNAVSSGEFTEFKDVFAEKGAAGQVSDPLEPVNRAMFWVNDKLYFYALKPAARAYRVVPESFRQSVDNFFVNLGTPVRFVNCLLQLKFRAAGNELRRFLVNSTLGVGGFLDPAGRSGWEMTDEDLGQTLGKYGIGSGIYLVLPVFGPANLRDGVGRVGDYFLDPIPYAIDNTGELMAVKGYDRVNVFSLDNDTYEKIKEQALDPYLFIRDAYAQRREALIRK